MKWYNNLSVKIKIPVMMGVTSLTVLAIVCLLLLIPLRSASLNDSTEIARLHAMRVADILAENVNGSVNILRTYSDIMAQSVESTIVPRDKKREMLLNDLQSLNDNNMLTSVWCILEPNALDRMDSLFIDKTGSNSKGIFSPRFFGNGMSSAAHMINTDSYIIPQTTGREFISEPYRDELSERMIFSIIVPLTVQGKFIGVVATDFDANELDNLIHENSNDNTLGKLVTDKGIIAVHYKPERIGQVAEYGNRNVLDRFPENETFDGIFDYEGRQQYKVFVPVSFSDACAPWYYGVDVPEDMIYQNARKTVKLLVVYFLFGVAFIAFAGWILISPVLKNVTGVTDIISKLSLGQINFNVDGSRNKDEIGNMKNELRQLIEGLQNTAEFAQSIGKGNLNAEFQLASSEDVLGNSLLEMQQSLQKAATEQSEHAKNEEQRSWGTAGLAKFAELLRNDNDNMEALSYNVISNMVKYLRVNQGGMFVLNESDNEEEMVLELKACYAFERKKFTEKQIHPGEGLVGTCFLEGETIYLTDVPDSYVTITSGLGKSNPKSILICPLKVNDKIFGVVELASFTEFEPYQIEFVEKVGESIAATISTVRVNIRTGHLLQQTKLQSEEMKNQEEEIRQSMEEMQSTQDEMRRREIELQEALSKMQIVQTSEEEFKDRVHWYESLLDAFLDNPVSVTDMDKNITFLNQAALNLLGKSKEETMGKYCGDVWGVDICKDERCGIECLKHKNGNSFFNFDDSIFKIDASYIKGRNGENIGHVEIVENITETTHREHEMKQLYFMISDTLNMVEFSSEGIITDINQNLLALWGNPDRSVFVGNHYSSFVGEENYKSVWDSMVKGIPYKDVRTITTGEGKQMDFRHDFMPICNHKNELLRVILLAFPKNADIEANV